MPARPEWPPTRVLAWLYFPVAQRPLLAALCGIESEIAASLAPGLDHQVAHARLGWWRDECQRCAQGRPAHPLTRALSSVFASGDLAPLAGLTGLVDAAMWDLAAATFDTHRELRAYCERWSVALIEPLMRFARRGGRSLPRWCASGIGRCVRRWPRASARWRGTSRLRCGACWSGQHSPAATRGGRSAPCPAPSSRASITRPWMPGARGARRVGPMPAASRLRRTMNGGL